MALGENSALAGRLIGDKIVHPRSIDLGFAVEAEDGVLVPVLRNADRTPLSELTGSYNELVELARQRRLPAGATGGSIATVTNFGTFGLEWATPIPLPEQTLVLGMGAGRIAPRWDAEAASSCPSRRRNSRSASITGFSMEAAQADCSVASPRYCNHLRSCDRLLSRCVTIIL